MAGMDYSSPSRNHGGIDRAKFASLQTFPDLRVVNLQPERFLIIRAVAIGLQENRSASCVSVFALVFTGFLIAFVFFFAIRRLATKVLHGLGSVA